MITIPGHHEKSGESCDPPHNSPSPKHQLRNPIREGIAETDDKRILMVQRCARGIGKKFPVRIVAAELESRQQVIDQLDLLGQSHALDSLRRSRPQSITVVKNLEAG